MVSYFLPRGRFLIKTGNLRETYQKPTKWPVRWTFRRSMTTKPQDTKVDPLQQIQHQQKSNIIATNKETNSPLNSLKRQSKNPWFSWSGLLWRWAPMGFCVFGAIEWQWHRNKVQKENLPQTASDFQAKVYCSLPLRIISRCWGWLASCYIPVSCRPFIYGWYSNSFGVNLEEALYSDLKHYESLAEFFTRPLKEGARVVDPHCGLVSPADGKVLHFGTASQSLVEQVKGINYRIDSFLGPNSWLKDSVNSETDFAEALRINKTEPTSIFQCVIYLAPGDYHRFHSPADWEPKIRRHFTGELLSVSPKVATWLPGLFCVNERALYIGKWLHGFFSFTAVGATNVGSVKIYVDEQLKTNRWVGLKVGSHKGTCSEFEELQLPEGTKLGKGELLGQFNMGSTVVLLFEAPRDFKFHIKQGQTIRMGEPLGYVEKQQQQ